MKKILSLSMTLLVLGSFVFAAPEVKPLGKDSGQTLGKDAGTTVGKDGGKIAPAAPAKVTALVQSYDAPEAKIDDTVICPVMTKNEFKVTKDSKFVTVKGKKYYVCCAGCDKELKATPDKFLKAEKKDDKTAPKK